MLRKTAAFVVLALLVFNAAPAARAAEPLFDTEALAQHIDKGVEHLMAKKYDAAIAEFTEATYIAPNAEAFYYLGYAYYMKGKNRKDAESRKLSMENFTRAYEIDPNFTPTRFRPEEEAASTARSTVKKQDMTPPVPDEAPVEPAPEPSSPPEAPPAEEPMPAEPKVP